MWYSVKLGAFERNFGERPKAVLDYISNLPEADKERIRIKRNYTRSYVEEIDVQTLTDDAR